MHASILASFISSGFAMDHCVLLLFLLLTAGGANAVVSPQLNYWQSALPNTAMPPAISDLINPVAVETHAAHVGVGVGVGHGVGVGVGVGHGVGVGVGVGHGHPPGFVYHYAATETQLHDDPNVALFFLEKDLKPGTKFNLLFAKTTAGAPFLPREAADSIPFSSSKFHDILLRFNIDSKSNGAMDMRRTLRDCETPSVHGEKKLCATSLESMVDFTTTTLGTRQIKAVSTTTSQEVTAKKPQQYVIATPGIKKLGEHGIVTCHAEDYVYAVFYCHATSTSKAYSVDMAGEDGTKVEAVAVCHTDTRAWNPNHVSFKVLNVKPGTLPVCHFLPQDHVVWSRSN